MDNPPMGKHSWVTRYDRNIPVTNPGSSGVWVACCQEISVYITGSENNWEYHFDYEYDYDLNISYQSGDATPYAEIYDSMVTARPFSPSDFTVTNTFTGASSLGYLFQVLQGFVRNINIYVNGELWALAETEE